MGSVVRASFSENEIVFGRKRDLRGEKKWEENDSTEARNGQALFFEHERGGQIATLFYIPNLGWRANNPADSASNSLLASLVSS